MIKDFILNNHIFLCKYVSKFLLNKLHIRDGGIYCSMLKWCHLITHIEWSNYNNFEIYYSNQDHSFQNYAQSTHNSGRDRGVLLPRRGKPYEAPRGKHQGQGVQLYLLSSVTISSARYYYYIKNNIIMLRVYNKHVQQVSLK